MTSSTASRTRSTWSPEATYTLLNKLPVADETRHGSYARSKFKLWVDANHDGENTRAEVLKAESLTKPVVKHGIVTTGKWTSRYDGKTYRAASKLVVNHLVPLQEAWTSGAAAWSAKKRSAYANDIGYGASLIAVSLQASRAKGDREPASYLPSKASYRCAWLRNWIAVKYRWLLTVDPTEKAELNAALTLHCTNPYVAKPTTPDLSALLDKTNN